MLRVYLGECAPDNNSVKKTRPFCLKMFI